MWLGLSAAVKNIRYRTRYTWYVNCRSIEKPLRFQSVRTFNRANRFANYSHQSIESLNATLKSSVNMQRNYNETEILNLMLNKDKFLRYIKHYEDNDSCTQLEPIIWALHFNIPKYQRLPLLENILFRSMAHIRKSYSFLPEIQIRGKTFEALGIPTVCAEPDKCFLNAYKKYKPYYPVRYPKSTTNTPVQYKNIIHSSIIKKPVPNARTRSFTPPLMNRVRINNSTPITEKIQSLMINPLMSPIKISMNDEHNQLWANSFFNGDHFLNEQNVTQNSIYHESEPTSLSNILESSVDNNFNVSRQTKCSNTTQEQNIEYFISRDPKNVPREYELESNNSKSDLNNLSDTWNEEHRMKERKNKCDDDKSKTSIYFYGSKKENYKESKFINLSTQNLEGKIKSDLKQNLSNKLEKNLSLQNLSTQNLGGKIKSDLKQNLSNKLERNLSLENLKKNSWIRKSMTNPPLNFKIIKHKTKKSCMKLNIRTRRASDNLSLLGLDKKSQIPTTIKSKLRTNTICSNIMDHDSIESENNNKRINYMNSQTFSDDSVFLPNSSQKLDSINLSQESNDQTNCQEMSETQLSA